MNHTIVEMTAQICRQIDLQGCQHLEVFEIENKRIYEFVPKFTVVLAYSLLFDRSARDF